MMELCASSVAATIQRAGAATGARSLARGHERREVADGPALDERAAGLGWEPGEVGDPPEGLVLREDGARPLEPAAAVDRAGAHDEVEESGGLRGGRGDEREVARMVRGDDAGGHDIGEQPEGRLPAEPLLRDGPPGTRRDLARLVRPVERRVHPHTVARVAEDRLREALGLVGVAMHPPGVAIARVVRPVRQRPRCCQLLPSVATAGA
jgi:hypothetical protein